MKLLVLIPFQERLNAYYGGAIARWINEVYSVTQEIEIKTCGVVCGDENDYMGLNIISRYSVLFITIQKIPFIRRILKNVYCHIYSSEIMNSEVLEIHNSYQYIDNIRKIGYTGKIFLHMHNDYLGSLSSCDVNKIERSVDNVFVCSNFLKNRIKGKSCALAKKTSVVYNGFNPHDFYPLSIDKDPMTLGYVGRVDFNKGLHLLLDVYQILLIRLPKIKLIIVGSSKFGGGKASAYERKCIEKINQINSELNGDIYFKGYVHNKDLIKYYNKFTLFCSFSIEREAFGMTYVEALACQTAVYANNIGGVSEAIGSTEMMIDNPPSAEKISSRIYSLLNNKKKLKSLSIKGCERVTELFTWEVIRNGKIDLLKSLE